MTNALKSTKKGMGVVKFTGSFTFDSKLNKPKTEELLNKNFIQIKNEYNI